MGVRRLFSAAAGVEEWPGGLWAAGERLVHCLHVAHFPHLAWWRTSEAQGLAPPISMAGSADDDNDDEDDDDVRTSTRSLA